MMIIKQIKLFFDKLILNIFKKYIKYDISNGNYVNIISDESFIMEKERIHIPYNDFLKIEKYIKEVFKLNIGRFDEKPKVFSLDYIKYIIVSDACFNLRIFKNKDDYFYIVADYVHSNARFSYYKCDQIEGLFKFLYDKLL